MSFWARGIMAVADTYDAITTSRCYRAGASHKKAVGILRAEAGKQFDADAVEAFLSHRHHRSARLVALLSAGPWRLVEWGLTWLRYGSAASIAQAGAVVVAASVAATSVSPATFKAENARSDRRTDPSSEVAQSLSEPSDDAVATIVDEDGDEVAGTTVSLGPTRPDGWEEQGDGASDGAPGTEAPGSDGGPGTSAGPGGDGPGSPGGGSGPGLPGVDDVVDGVNDTVGGVVDGVNDTVGGVVDGVNDTVNGVVDGVLGGFLGGGKGGG